MTDTPTHVDCKRCGEKKIPYGTDRCPQCKSIIKGSSLPRLGGKAKAEGAQRAEKLLEGFDIEYDTAPEHIKLMAEKAVSGGQGDMRTFLNQMDELKPSPKSGLQSDQPITKLVIQAETVEAAEATLQHLKDYVVQAEREVEDDKAES